MKTKLALLSIAALSTTLVFPVVSLAADPKPATSKNHIQFETDSSVEPPVDPTDPNNPDPPVDPVDPENPGTGNEGPLSIDFVSNIEFGTNKISGQTAVYNAKNENPYVQVSDKTGTGDGWQLTAAATEFKNSDGSKTLTGAELSFLNGTANSASSNVSAAPTIASTVAFSNQASQTIMTAAKDAGQGTWVDVWSGTANDNNKVQLKVLAGSASADDYTATINWTLTAGPTAP